MQWCKSLATNLIILFALFAALKAQRRIVGGSASRIGKSYMVYLIKSVESKVAYDSWLCGGTIISEWYILTSAACVEDVPHMYAIAGTNEYVPTHKLDMNACAAQGRRKIVFICVPRSYELDYRNVETWSSIDIAVIKVDKKYILDAPEPPDGCLNSPHAIDINYEAKYQEPGIETMIMGFGHTKKWRMQDDTKDYNQEIMQFASTVIHDKEECKKYFADYPLLQQVIDKYMICTLEGGNLDESGNEVRLSKPIADGCTPYLESKGYLCQQDETIDLRRKNIDVKNTLSRILQRQQTRRQGICQNDHGGPLVAYIGGHEKVIGVASVFRITNESTCTGPYLYTSTQCNGAFLSCLLQNNRRSAYNCDRPASESGYSTYKKSITWENHPDGPAANERIMTRAKPPFDKEHPWTTRR